MRIDQLKPGQVLFSVESGLLGRGMRRTVSVYRVVIGEVLGSANGDTSFTASWNGKPFQRHYSVPKHWTAKKPVLIASSWGQVRATKAERENGQIKDQGLYMQVMRDA